MARYTLSEPLNTPIRMAEVLAAFSLATDLGTGKPMGHAMRACYLGMKIADLLRLQPQEKVELYYSFLLMHSGCTVLSFGLASSIRGDELAAIGDITLLDDTDPLEMLAWLRRNVARGKPLPERAFNIIGMLLHMHEAEDHRRGACEVAVQVAQRLDMPKAVQEAVRYYQERWDGKGPYRLKGSDIPLSARILQLALKIESVSTARGRQESEVIVQEQRGRIFDPQIADAFLDVARHTDLWETLEKKDLWEEVLGAEPDSAYRNMDESKLDVVALAAADFVDLKSPLPGGHSRETARIAEGMARRMRLPSSEITDIRRAGLVHDLGHIALPQHILFPEGPLSEADKEKLRLHPYYTERILARVPALRAVAAIAGKHHERLNGTGYYRGLFGNELPLSACILALADEYQERCQARPEQNIPDPKDIL